MSVNIATKTPRLEYLKVVLVALYWPLPVGMLVVVAEMGRYAFAMAQLRVPLAGELTIRTNLLVNA